MPGTATAIAITGAMTVIATSTGATSGPSWSPDGSRLAFAAHDDQGQRLLVMRADGDALHAVTTPNLYWVEGAAWSPDGRRMAFVRSVYLADGDVETTVWTMDADGRDARPLVTLPHVSLVDWHPDGTTLLIDTYDKSGGGLLDVWPIAQLKSFVAAARDLEMMIVLGGSLSLNSLPAARTLDPDYIAVRGAACRGGRTGMIDENRVRALRAALDQNPKPS